MNDLDTGAVAGGCAGDVAVSSVVKSSMSGTETDRTGCSGGSLSRLDD